MEKKKIAIVGANEFQNPLILKAKSLGYETHVFSTPFGKIGERTADYFYPISIFDKEEILKKCQEIMPDAITTIASDAAVPSVNYVAEKLGLKGNSYKHTLEFTNKYEMRTAFKKAGIDVPMFKKVFSSDELTEMTFPVIVKPTDRAGSMAISLVTNNEELQIAINNAIESSFENACIVEGVIEGDREYSCETISYNSKHYILAVTKKYTTGFPKCIETAQFEPSDLDNEELDNLEKIIPIALNALHITDGPSHVEFKVDDKKQIHIIEIGARMGGDCIGTHLVELSTGYDFLGMTLDVSLGKKPNFEKSAHCKYALTKFIFSTKDIDKLNLIIEKYPEILIEESELEDMNREIVDNASRYGYYVLAFDEEDIKNYLLNEIKIFD